MRIILLLLAALSTPALATDMSGPEVYESTCKECHSSGKLNAPKFGDKKQWKKLIAEGLDDLVPMALKGIRAMPPKGGNINLSDIEVARAVVYMTNAAGGKFAEPTASDVSRWRKTANGKQVK
jgi:cytochrome c5